MSKKRRTKQQKIIAQLKRQLYKDNKPINLSEFSEKENILQSLQIKTELNNKNKTGTDYKPQIIPSNNYLTNKPKKDYSYVKSDIKKTLSLTLIIIFINLLIFFLTEKNIVNFSYLGF